MLENMSVKWALWQTSVGGLTLWWLFQRWIIKHFWQEWINILFQVRIFGGPDIYVREGSSLQLECVISQTIVSPKFVVWEYNGELVPGSSFIKVQDSPSTSSSTLSVGRVTRYQAGNYSCHPDNLHPAPMTLHVLSKDGEHLPITGGFKRISAPSHESQLLFLILVSLLSSSQS